MNIRNKTIWQIAAGNGDNTHYAKFCLDNDVIVFGPGKYGRWPDCRILMLADGWTARKAGAIKKFATEIKPGDIVVLRVGTQEVYGVGEVVGPYGHSNLFGNVQSWDLQHYRRVRWLWHRSGTPKVFPVYSLKFGSSVQCLISDVVKDWVETLDIPPAAYARPLADINNG